MDFIASTAAYIVSYLAAERELYFLSGAVLMAAAAGLALYFYRKNGRLLCPAVIFSLSWLGGVGISCLKLSYLQAKWEMTSWICFYLSYEVFITAYKLTSGMRDDTMASLVGADGTKESIWNVRDGKTASRSMAMQAQEEPCESQRQSMETQAAASGIGEMQEKDPTMYMQLRASMADFLLRVMEVIAAVSLLSLAAEGALLGYIPLFTVDTPHAYSYFHVSGLHYFTVSCVLLPALAVLYVHAETGRRELRQEILNYLHSLDESDPDSGSWVVRKYLLRGEWIDSSEILALSLCTAVGIVVPILLVSRYQLFFGLMLAASTWLVLNGTSRRGISAQNGVARRLPGSRVRRWLLFACAFAALLALYVFLTVQRAHSVAYLNGIFEMKNAQMPIFISQPYIYIANNFDNFNCLVRELPQHTHGLRMLFPAIALTGLKFLRPALAAFPIYVTKEELTTVTLIYDAYYDFGTAGVVAFAAVLGAVSGWLEKKTCRIIGHDPREEVGQRYYVGGGRSPRAYTGRTGTGTDLFLILLYAQLCVYLALAFFTTWFSNPTTWFYFGVTALIALAVKLKEPRI